MFLNELLSPAAIPTQLQCASFAEIRKKSFNISTGLFVCLFPTKLLLVVSVAYSSCI